MQKAIRVIALVAVFGLIFVALVTSSVKPANLEEKVWNEEMVIGDLSTATRHYIVYTDLMCPYCNYYAKVIMDNEDTVKEFISEHKIAYEVRVTDMLYEGNGVLMSRPSAEGAYCAAKEGKFWDYYHLAVSSLFEDYYARGIGSSKTAPAIDDMERSYWLELGKEAGLGETFETCFNNNETAQTVQENTLKASVVAGGLPYFVFGRYTNGGFDPTWDWTQVETMLKAGLN